MLRTLISIAGPPFRAIHKTREAAYKSGLFSCYEADVPVISIGNLTTGGVGKTPLVIWLASRLCSRGSKPAVVSRGYGGANRQKYLVVSDGNCGKPLHDPSVVGDEPYLIACRIPTAPVLIGRKRMHPIRAVQELFSVDVIILDDGFQHLGVARDLDVVVLTGAEDEMVPIIQLREPLSALRRADVFFQSCLGEGHVTPRTAKLTPMFVYRHCVQGLVTSAFPFEVVDTSYINNKSVTLVSAIARPERFLNTAKTLGWNIVRHVTYRDHHFFSIRELQKLVSADPYTELVFTEKDWVKLPAWFQRLKQTWALRIDVQVEEEQKFLKLVAEKIRDFSSSQ